MKRFRFLLFCGLLLLLVGGSTEAAMTYGLSAYSTMRGSDLSRTPADFFYKFVPEVEAMLEGTSPFDAIRLLESTGATYYTQLQAGNQSGNLTLTLPTAYAGSAGYVLSSTTAGVLSWVANGGTFTGGAISSDVTLAGGVDIYSSTTNAHTSSIGVYRGSAYVDAFRWTNETTTPALVLGASITSLAITSTGLNVSTAGAVTGVTTLSASGAVTATGGVTLQNGGTVTNSVDSEITFTDAGEDLTLDLNSSSNVVGLKSSTGVTGLAMGAVDDLSGVGSIAFDVAAASITTATTSGAQDLTLAITGATDSSLVLASAGTGADALTITASAGGMDLVVSGSSADDDLDITSDSSINIVSSESSADAGIVISSAGTGSGIQI
ncbi:MAG TPA: hypothetical protein VMZ31_02560, partial [Phycisphaerae bacterium]|nr:hypothetical protein [Phycisphaerae bacterium]